MAVIELQEPARQAEDRPSVWRKAITWGLIAVAAGLFIAVNVKTCEAACPWTDEVMQVDAGVNLHFGKGWVSTAWPSQSQYQFWAGNNPLYTLLVYCWISMLGFSLVAVRSLNYVLIFPITWLLVDACRRMGIVRAAWGSALLAMLLITDGSVTYVYRHGRADLATMLVLALLFWIYGTVLESRRRWRLLFVCSFLLLPTGIQSVPYIVALFGLEYFVLRKLSVRDFAAIVCGSVTGGLGMALFFLWKHALFNYAAETFASDYNIVGCALQLAVFRDQLALDRFMTKIYELSPINVVQTMSFDQSQWSIVLFFVCGLAATALWVKSPKLRALFGAGLFAAIFIPYAMFAAGHYLIYYEWMGAAPLAIVLVLVLELCRREGRKWLWGLGLAASATAIAAGMPWEVWNEALAAQPAVYSRVRQQLHEQVGRGETLYADPVFYFAAKADGVPFLASNYAGGRGHRYMGDAERAQVSVVMVKETDVADARRKLGGSWTEVKVIESPYGFPLTVLRRKTE